MIFQFINKRIFLQEKNLIYQPLTDNIFLMTR